MTPLPRCTPSAQNTDARGVSAFLDAIDGESGVEAHSLMLLRHGHVIAEGWWAPYSPQGIQHLYSLSKSFTGTAAGLAWAEGLLDLDAPVISHFPELDAEITDPRSRSILVRHIASMAAGHTAEQWDRAWAADRDEPVRGFLLHPPDGVPGTTFAYSQPTTYTLAAVIQRVTGQTLTEYLRPRLFEPLGIDKATWVQHPAGRDIGFIGLSTTTEAVARLGQLYAQGGVWDGRQLLAPEWVAEATRAQVGNSGTGSNPDWSQGYGFQFWMSRHGYRGDGAYGQFCVVLPEQDAVLALTAETEDMQAVLDAAWTHLLPAFEGAGHDAAAADKALEHRLTGLQLPFPTGAEVPTGEFTAASSVLSRLTRVALSPQVLALHEDDGTVTTLPLVPGAWPTREHMAARAARTDADTVVVHVQFVQTPHKLRITCDLRTGTFDAGWRTIPLTGRPSTALSALAQPTPLDAL
ncbi:serine hydrolase [Catenulispora subtropica]|uniref:Beta-lactamase-related domain-containing protein n=1 Tax=Catenulispora subtropica TaxID=450798 RepID=A0ABP5CS60_9ACTN